MLCSRYDSSSERSSLVAAPSWAIFTAIRTMSDIQKTWRPASTHMNATKTQIAVSRGRSTPTAATVLRMMWKGKMRLRVRKKTTAKSVKSASVYFCAQGRTLET